jgi:hypothetical protein
LFRTKQPRPFVSALQSVAAVEASTNQLLRDFRYRSIFDFWNSIPSTAGIESAHQMIWNANVRFAHTGLPHHDAFRPGTDLPRRANQWFVSCLAFCRENFMHAQSSELVEISKLNGDFKKNYGKLIGAYLYLRSISAARGRSFFWTGLISIVCSAALAWLARHGLAWLHVD